MNKKLPTILVLDIETSPIISYTWGLFDQDVGLNQIVEDWHLLSYSAKILGSKKVYYADQSKARKLSDDKNLLKGLWKLLNEADVVIGQNSVAFDIKKIKARMIIHGMKPPSGFKQIDTLRIAKKHFGFTSNKLEYLSTKLCPKHKKSTHKRFSGFDLWKQCMAGNKKAWAEMKRYNIQDVLATEELYLKLQPYDNSYNPNVYLDTNDTVCACGSKKFQRNGFAYTSMGKYQRYSCADCGAEVRERTNLLTRRKRQSLMGRT